MSLFNILQPIFKTSSLEAVYEAAHLKEPRNIAPSEFLYWQELKSHTNPVTMKPYSYRDIRRVLEAEGRHVPSLSTLSKYLGKDKWLHQELSREAWKDYFKKFGNAVRDNPDLFNTEPEEWEEFEYQYSIFLGLTTW